MKKPTNTSTNQSTHQGIQKNPEQRLEPKVAKALAGRRAALSEFLRLQNESGISVNARNKFLKARQTSYAAAAKSIGLDFNKISSDLKEAYFEKNSSVAKTLKDRLERWKEYGYTLKPGDLHFPKPTPADPTFWWAETWATVAPDMTFNFESDGLHFTGGPTENNWNDDVHPSFGITAHFALQPDRRPESVSGLYRSSPSVEILGGVVAYAPDYDLLQGHGEASCNLVLRQKIFQWGFGETGPVQMTVAEAVSNDPWHISLEDTGYSRHAGMPGLKPLPSVTFATSNFAAPQDLWAELEVRFDIYLKQEGALLWCDPEVILRTFQWPLETV